MNRCDIDRASLKLSNDVINKAVVLNSKAWVQHITTIRALLKASLLVLMSYNDPTIQVGVWELDRYCHTWKGQQLTCLSYQNLFV